MRPTDGSTELQFRSERGLPGASTSTPGGAEAGVRFSWWGAELESKLRIVQVSPRVHPELPANWCLAG